MGDEKVAGIGSDSRGKSEKNRRDDTPTESTGDGIPNRPGDL